MFRRAHKRPWLRAVWRGLWPRGGWFRAFIYLIHRLRRLRDSPGRVSRGAFAGTLVAFTPFYGLHFFIAPLLAWALGGNMLASIIFVMICNPLTFVPIAVVSISMGNVILGAGTESLVPVGVLASDLDVLASSLWQNVLAIFTDRVADWTVVQRFLTLFLLPYLVGGLLVGLVVAPVLAWLARVTVAMFQEQRLARVAVKQHRDDQ